MTEMKTNHYKSISADNQDFTSCNQTDISPLFSSLLFSISLLKQQKQNGKSVILLCNNFQNLGA